MASIAWSGLSGASRSQAHVESPTSPFSGRAASGAPLKGTVRHSECRDQYRLPQPTSVTAATAPVDVAREAAGPRPKRCLRSLQKGLPGGKSALLTGLEGPGIEGIAHRIPPLPADSFRMTAHSELIHLSV
jgi:hypothetical protein